jgi:arginase
VDVDLMETIGVPYHQDELIPDFDVGVPVDHDVTVDLPDGDTWTRMGILYDEVARVVSEHPPPFLVVSGACLTSLGILAGLQRSDRDPGIVWIDAHGDFNTEATTPSGYLGGMPLALAVGVGTLTLPLELGLRPVPTSRVVLVGARDIDPEEQILLDRSDIEQRGLDVVARDLPPGDLYVHVDIDICDPRVVPDLLFPAPGGPDCDVVVTTVRRIMATGRVVAVDLAATWHQNGPSATTQRGVMRRLKEAVMTPSVISLPAQAG